jgi:creatinine amidohydrolase/Fe(II)-dependent formamide hydrolase-like protein
MALMHTHPENSGGTEVATADHSAWDRLVVIDELVIGPVRVERRRISAPYRIKLVDGGRRETEFAYAFEEDVFDPQEAESHNLASMMTAQIGINYGLFCRKIVYVGTFDAQDRRLIRSMTENTSREIAVNKLLKPNPFLVGTAVGLPAVKRRRFTRAALSFRKSATPAGSVPWKLWKTDKGRYCILSSGGKDSLLSFGLLDEVVNGPESVSAAAQDQGQVHPIFVNESGRHWFTALNAYRHFREKVPQTARVWVNSDRVFAWFLRLLPFIRKDFASVRADIYPIRLWTVAVFLFGVLPLMRKRRIGRLLIGDEYDTTVTETDFGIRHYAGLFDQSHDFDRAMSGYFLRKGWSISQFSILRPLSELLIQKTLALRFPQLQRHQVSCHAGHKDGDRVRPCGRCEKCRRIIGMLTALGADPKACGYEPSRIENCLGRLSAEGVHQEAEGFEQMMYLLEKNGRLRSGDDARSAPRTEVMKLRFHPRRSPFNAIPSELRRPLYRIFLEYAEGAVVRRGNRWHDIDVFSSREAIEPYPFDMEPLEEGYPAAGPDGDDAGTSVMWGEMSWPEATETLKRIDVALLPIGAVEQHGPHLPLDTDAFDAAYLAKRVAEACSDPRPLVLPLIPYGVSYHHEGFKGTVSVSNHALENMVYDVGMSLAANGIRKLIIINGHGGNAPALNFAAQRINRDAKIFVCVDTGESSDVDINGLAETPNDVHAGEIETSTTLAVRPHLVKRDLARAAIPSFSSRYLNFSSTRGVNWYAYTRNISQSGVMGDPTRASADKGARIWEMMVAHLAAFVEDLKNLTLEEIHQKRY